MLTFKQVGKTNTDVTLKLAIQTALEREMDLVVATTKAVSYTHLTLPTIA